MQTPTRWQRSVHLGALLLVCWAAPLWAALADQYRLTDLGAYEAAAIDKTSGRVLGFQGGTRTPQAFQLTPTLSPLGAFQPSSVQGTRAVGEMWVGDVRHAVRHSIDGTLTDLGLLAGVSGHSIARCVNADGDVAGGVDDDTTGFSPVLWLDGTTRLDLPTWAPTLGGQALACNDRGDAAGYAHVEGGNPHCTFWGNDGALVDCHPQSGMAWSLAADMTSSGMLVGNTGPRIGIYGYVWMWSGIHWLMPAEGDLYTRVLSINERGDTVGQSYVKDPDADSPTQAVAWEKDGAVVLQARTLNADGWTFLVARGIANDGSILVHGMLGDEVHTALLKPVETSAAAWATWRHAIWQYYVDQYWRAIRAALHGHEHAMRKNRVQ